MENIQTINEEFNPDKLKKLYKKRTLKEAIKYLKTYFFKISDISEFLYFDVRTGYLLLKDFNDILEILPKNAYYTNNKIKIFLKDEFKKIEVFNISAIQLKEMLNAKGIKKEEAPNIFYHCFKKELLKKSIKDFIKRTGKKPTESEKMKLLENIKDFLNEKVIFSEFLHV